MKKPAAGEDEVERTTEASTATPAQTGRRTDGSGPPAVDARAWVLLDYATGRVLAGEHVDDPLEPGFDHQRS